MSPSPRLRSVARLTAMAFTTVGVRFVVTAVRLTTGTGGGDLRLIAWDANLR